MQCVKVYVIVRAISLEGPQSMKLYFAPLLFLAACGTTTGSQNSKTIQTNAPASVTPQTSIANQQNQAQAAIATPIPSATVADSNTVVDNANVLSASNGNVTVNANETNPNSSSRNPVTGLFDYRFGSFVVGDSGKTDSRNYDGCHMLTGTTDPSHPGYLHGSFVFQYSQNESNVFLANGAITISGTGDPAYAQGTMVTITTLYPDGTGSLSWYRPATPTVPSCYSFYASITVDTE